MSHLPLPRALRLLICSSLFLAVSGCATSPDSSGGATASSVSEARSACPEEAASLPDGQATDPVLLNRETVLRLMKRSYPDSLRDRGFDGRVLVFVSVGSDGSIEDLKLGSNPGIDALNQAAFRVALAMRFRPACSNEGPVSAVVPMPLGFRVER